MLQNKAAKLILDKPLCSSVPQLGWLSLEQRRLFHRCLYVYKCVNAKKRRSDVHSYITRNKDDLIIRFPSVKRNWEKQQDLATIPSKIGVI